MVSRNSQSVLTGLLLICLATLARADDFLSPGIAPADLLERLDSDQAPLVVDLRAPAEYRVAHIPGALNVPSTELKARIEELRNANGVVIYCLNGSRTRQAEPVLYAHDIDNFYHLEGTLQAWLQQKLPYEKGGVKPGW
jgi:rhodanese-related sulfurtransferase